MDTEVGREEEIEIDGIRRRDRGTPNSRVHQVDTPNHDPGSYRRPSRETPSSSSGYPCHRGVTDRDSVKTTKSTGVVGVKEERHRDVAPVFG